MIANKILSDIIVHMKYAKYIPHKKRRENWYELVTRNKEMHLKKHQNLKDEIEEAYKYVYDKKVLPSMRSLQFAGKSIEISPNRIYNCSFLPVDAVESFQEIMFLLLGGSGVGVSVQKHHIKKLPSIKKPGKLKRYLIGDSIEGWADAVKVLMNAYFNGSHLPNFDFSDIRPKGAKLITSGGKAPGPQPLKDCLHNIQKILDSVGEGEKLKSIQAHDIICYIADAVLAGGIRRAALISLFSFDDEDMLSCKFGNWWELNPQRARANNSVVLLRHRIKEEDFNKLWKKIELSKSGEPGFLFSNDKEVGTNPCVVGSTKVLTNKGFVEIQKLSKIYNSDKNIKIITQDKYGELFESELNWCGITNKDDNIYKIYFNNGCFQLTNITHKFYKEDFSEISVQNTINNLNNGEIVNVLGYNRIVNIIKVEKLNYNEPVYDLTATPNFNFFANYCCDETFGEEKIEINESIYFYPYEIINTQFGKKFAKDLEICDDIL